MILGKHFITKAPALAAFLEKYTYKWQKFYKAIPVIRLAEMYLTRGEANLRKGGTPIGGIAPLSDINMVRTRSGANALTAVSAADFCK